MTRLRFDPKYASPLRDNPLERGLKLLRHQGCRQIAPVPENALVAKLRFCRAHSAGARMSGQWSAARSPGAAGVVLV